MQRKRHDYVLALAIADEQPTLARSHRRLLTPRLDPLAKQTKRIVPPGTQVESGKGAVKFAQSDLDPVLFGFASQRRFVSRR